MSQKGVKPPPPLLCFVASRGCFSLLSYFKTPPLCFATQKYRVRCHGVTEGFGNKLTIASICECMIGSVSVSGEMLKNWWFVESGVSGINNL